MKKFVTTLLLTALTAVSACAFTACGGDEESNEPVYTVTADEWNTALNYFNVKLEEGVPVKSEYPRINFLCKFNCVYYGETEEQNETYTMNTSIDFSKKIMAEDYIHDGITDNFYVWKGENGCFGVGDGWELNEETNKREYHYLKEEVNEDDLPLTFDSNICEYAGGRYINELDLVNKFSSFTYSEEKKEYTATLDYEEYEGTCDLTLKFKDGKLVHIAANINGKKDKISGNFEYTYGTTASVPDFFLNLKLGKTPKENKN